MCGISIVDGLCNFFKYWESRPGTAEERPDAESTAPDGAEAAKPETSATSAKHLDIF